MQAREFKYELDEANAMLKKVTQSERSMSASMASLRAEIKTMQNEMIAVKEEGDQAMAEKDEQIEEEMTRMRTEWQSAVSSEARLTEEVSTLTESLEKVSGCNFLSITLSY